MHAGMLAEAEHGRLVEESQTAKQELQQATQQVKKLSAEMDAQHQAHEQLQVSAEQAHAALIQQHEAEVADMRICHHHVVSDLKAALDDTHCKLATALAENGMKSTRIVEAGDALATCERKLCETQEALCSQMAQLQVLGPHVLCSCIACFSHAERVRDSSCKAAMHRNGHMLLRCSALLRRPSMQPRSRNCRSSRRIC
jgi:hypothetical protein